MKKYVHKYDITVVNEEEIRLLRKRSKLNPGAIPFVTIRKGKHKCKFLKEVLLMHVYSFKVAEQ